MKKLSIEEKAKAYDNVRDKIAIRFGSNVAKEIFSEYEESDDERIKREIIDIINSYDVAHLKAAGLPSRIPEYITFLEKQGEKKSQGKSALEAAKEEKVDNQNCIKPTNKVEPKFKVGDFIANDYCFGKVIELTDDAYLLDTGQGIPFSCEHNAHLCTIQDAKVGDVLVHNDCTFIFMGIKDGIVQAIDENMLSVPFGNPNKDNDYHLATKEQRDLLFQKMKEAGYKWDADKKELKKVEQKPSWSEEDEKILKAIHNSVDVECLSKNGLDYVVMVDWFKSLKNRMQPQPKQEWSIYDETILKDLIDHFEYKKEFNEAEDYDIVLWLKSLRPQNNITDEELAQAKKDAYNDALDKIEYHSDTPTFDDGWSAAIWYLKKRNVQLQTTWKPSDEQMKVLKMLTDTSKGFDHSKILKSLYNDLKKLREE